MRICPATRRWSRVRVGSRLTRRPPPVVRLDRRTTCRRAARKSQGITTASLRLSRLRRSNHCASPSMSAHADDDYSMSSAGPRTPAKSTSVARPASTATRPTSRAAAATFPPDVRQPPAPRDGRAMALQRADPGSAADVNKGGFSVVSASDQSRRPESPYAAAGPRRAIFEVGPRRTLPP